MNKDRNQSEKGNEEECRETSEETVEEGGTFSRRGFLHAAGAIGAAAAFGGISTKLFAQEAGSASDSTLAVTVLGSGGPMVTVDRASPGYLVYVDGVPRIMMDGGGGTCLSLGQGRIVNLERLDMWLFSHLHIDHCAEFPAIMKSMYYLRRSYNTNNPLTIIGPEGGGKFPGTTEFVDKMFNPKDGIFAYLHDFLETVYAPPMKLETRDVPYDYTAITDPRVVFEKDGIQISSIPVMHGPDLATPSVAFRVDYGGKSITYSGDLNSDTGNLLTLAMGSDVLIYDASLSPAQRMDPPGMYHSLPGEIGQTAQAAGVRTLVLSHFMPPYTDRKTQEIVDGVKRFYTGEVVLATDLLTVTAG